MTSVILTIKRLDIKSVNFALWVAEHKREAREAV